MNYYSTKDLRGKGEVRADGTSVFEVEALASPVNAATLKGVADALDSLAGVVRGAVGP